MAVLDRPETDLRAIQAVLEAAQIILKKSHDEAERRHGR